MKRRARIESAKKRRDKAGKEQFEKDGTKSARNSLKKTGQNRQAALEKE